jgi:hypothetical protein
MATFLVECYWVGVLEADARQALDRLRRGGSRRGGEIAPLASFLLPSEEVLFVLVESSSQRAALRASREAGIPVDRVSSVVALDQGLGPLP